MTIEEILHSSAYSRRQKVAAIIHVKGGVSTVKNIREFATELGIHEAAAWNIQDVIGKSQGQIKNLKGKIILTTNGKERIRKEGIVLSSNRPIQEKVPEARVDNFNGSELIIISHAEKDQPLVKLIVELLCVGLGISSKDIFASSLDGQGFDGEDKTREKIKTTLRHARIVFCLITPTYKTREVCMNELGAAWGLEKPLVALVSDPMSLGSAAFLIDVQHQLSLSNSAKVSSLADILAKHEVIPSRVKSELWTGRLKIFQEGLDAALDACKFEEAAIAYEKQASVTVVETKQFSESVRARLKSGENNNVTRAKTPPTNGVSVPATTNNKNWVPARLLREGKLNIGDEIIFWAATDLGISDNEPRIHATIRTRLNKCLQREGSSERYSFASLRKTIINELALKGELNPNFGYGVSREWGLKDGRRLIELG